MKKYKNYKTGNVTPTPTHNTDKERKYYDELVKLRKMKKYEDILDRLTTLITSENWMLIYKTERSQRGMLNTGKSQRRIRQQACSSCGSNCPR